MSNHEPLSETRRPQEYTLTPETALADYMQMRLANALAVAKAVGVEMESLSYRIYGDRLMWRLSCLYEIRLSRDEVRRIVWDLAVKGFGAFKPELYNGDLTQANDVVAVWFTDGGKQAIQGVKF